MVKSERPYSSKIERDKRLLLLLPTADIRDRIRHVGRLKRARDEPNESHPARSRLLGARRWAIFHKASPLEALSTARTTCKCSPDVGPYNSMPVRSRSASGHASRKMRAGSAVHTGMPSAVLRTYTLRMSAELM